MTTTTRLKATALSAAAATVLGLGLAIAPAGTADASTPSCNRVVGTVGSIPTLSYSKRSWPLTGGLHMSTSGVVNRNLGGVSGTTHIYNSYWAMGYTGSVMVVAKNSCGEVIGVTVPQRWGVDAKVWFWSANERHEYWRADLPPDVARRTASVEVIHNRVTGTNYKKAYEDIRNVACQVYKAINPNPLAPCPFPTLP